MLCYWIYLRYSEQAHLPVALTVIWHMDWSTDHRNDGDKVEPARNQPDIAFTRVSEEHCSHFFAAVCLAIIGGHCFGQLKAASPCHWLHYDPINLACQSTCKSIISTVRLNWLHSKAAFCQINFLCLQSFERIIELLIQPHRNREHAL